jgi:integrase
VSIEVRVTAKGERRYDVRLRDPAGKSYVRTFRTRRDAERFESTEQADKARGSWLDPRGGDMLVKDWAARWLDSNPAKSPSSYARDESVIRLHITPEIGSERIGAVTQPRIQALVNIWTARSKPRTVHRQYDTLSAIFAAAVDGDLISRSPCRKIKLPVPDAVRRRVIEGPQLDALAAALGGDCALMVFLAVELGLRWGEVAGLRICDVDFNARQFNVVEQRTRGRNGVMVTRRPKSEAGRRHVAASAWLLLRTREHLAARGIADLDSTEPVFVTSDGEGLDYSNWYHRVWVPATIAIRRPGLQFHDLRRTNATALVQEGVDVKTAQERLGHSDPRLTIGLYAQVTSAAERDAADRLGERFRPGQSAVVRPARAMDARWNRPTKKSGRRKGALTRRSSSREGGIRTRDLSVPNAAR